MFDIIKPDKPIEKHSVTVDNREKINCTGVSEVLSFDDNIVVCRTGLGVLSIKGSDLRVSGLNTETGILDVTGTVDSLVYENGAGYRSKQSVLGRIFK